MKKFILGLALAGFAASCNSTADVSDTSEVTEPAACTAEADADCATACEGADATDCDTASSCEGKEASECSDEAKVCPVTGKSLE